MLLFSKPKASKSYTLRVTTAMEKPKLEDLLLRSTCLSFQEGLQFLLLALHYPSMDVGMFLNANQAEMFQAKCKVERRVDNFLRASHLLNFFLGLESGHESGS
ncbi:hypothetical protein GLYMA_06G277550v4 [Glycine max]|nr:hypothetical protein GLYMA_06G277550v4 [Glycine max]KAH1127913.1 hypothetical protein GYH30_016464 [Glycine max]